MRAKHRLHDVRFFATVGIIAAAIAPLGANNPRVSSFQPELETVLSRDLLFSPTDFVDLQRGRIVTHTLPRVAPEEVGIVGAVRIQGSRERLIAAYRDIVTFVRSPAVIAVGRFSNPPDSSDLDALKTDRNDFDLRGCKVTDCDIRLPASTIETIATTVDWRRPDAEARVTALFKEMLLVQARSDLTGAPGRITQYDDGRTPVRPMLASEELIGTSRFLDALHPGLSAHVTCFWSSPIDTAEDFLYWTKQTFGLSPFVSVTHVTIVPSGPHQSLAINRDIYSSRYIDGSLSMMIASDAAADENGFYLVYVNRSRASALRGPLGGLRRTIVEHKVKGALREYLREIKVRFEVL
jgi:hypothetical protein